MRIRCRSINYETLALDAEVTETSQYEFLSHLQMSDQQDLLNDEGGKSCFEILGSAVPAELFYLRPIPIQPAFDEFEAQINAASSSATESIDSNRLKMFCQHDTRCRSGGTARRKNESECSDFLLEFGQDLEDEAVALRNQLDELLPQLLKHVGNEVLPKCDSCFSEKGAIQCGQWVNRLFRKSGDSHRRQKYDVDECHRQKWKRETIDATGELSSLLLDRIHKLQYFDFEHDEVAKSSHNGEMDYSAFWDWLEERKERWKSERFYRRVSRSSYRAPVLG